MILSCDPPRHAFLIHFGKLRQPDTLQTFGATHEGAGVEVALNPDTAPPTLVAVHFVRHKFRLPFIGSPDMFSTNYFHLHSGRRQNRHFFHFSYEPEDCREWQACPGLTILLSGPAGGRYVSDNPEDRPVLRGLVVDLETLQVDVDMSEFVFEFGADNLKDVPVTLFVDYSRD